MLCRADQCEQILLPRNHKWNYCGGSRSRWRKAPVSMDEQFLMDSNCQNTIQDRKTRSSNLGMQLKESAKYCTRNNNKVLLKISRTKLRSGIREIQSRRKFRKTFHSFLEIETAIAILRTNMTNECLFEIRGTEIN
ncbi:unnamed protein product [Dicrocoelium dendriticum]|nr:unnamed protein product [Dicrocoelium dendriticum]